MEQLKRIEHMEKALDEVSAAVRALSEALDNYLVVQEQLWELSDYYGSEQWLRDYDDDCAGKLPQDLKRGVLSEDAVYNLLEENERISEQMRAVAGSF